MRDSIGEPFLRRTPFRQSGDLSEAHSERRRSGWMPSMAAHTAGQAPGRELDDFLIALGQRNRREHGPNALAAIGACGPAALKPLLPPIAASTAVGSNCRSIWQPSIQNFVAERAAAPRCSRRHDLRKPKRPIFLGLDGY